MRLSLFDKDVVKIQVDTFYDGISPETLCDKIKFHMEKVSKEDRNNFILEFIVEEDYEKSEAVLVLYRLQRLAITEIKQRNSTQIHNCELQIELLKSEITRLKKENK